MSDELAAAVRHAREAAGLTVEQLSARTKIRGVVLRDLESGSTERSGGAAYARGHLRAIASATGADAAVLLAAHDAATAAAAEAGPGPGPGRPGLAGPGPRVAGPGPRVAGPEPRVAGAASRGPQLAPAGALGLPTATRERGGPRWGLALLAATAVLATFMLVGVLVGRDRPDGADEVAAGRSPSTTAPVVPAPTPATQAPAPPPTAAALRLAVKGGTSWVDVLSQAGETLFRGVLPAGTSREFSDPAGLSVTIGNAGAVTLGCGGADVQAGRRGQVKKFTCAPDGLAPA